MKLDRKRFFLNYAQYLLIVAGAIIVLGFGFGAEGERFDFGTAYGVVSFFAIIILGYLLAKKFSQ